MTLHMHAMCECLCVCSGPCNSRASRVPPVCTGRHHRGHHQASHIVLVPRLWQVSSSAMGTLRARIATAARAMSQKNQGNQQGEAGRCQFRMDRTALTSHQNQIDRAKRCVGLYVCVCVWMSVGVPTAIGCAYNQRHDKSAALIYG